MSDSKIRKVQLRCDRRKCSRIFHAEVILTGDPDAYHSPVCPHCGNEHNQRSEGFLTFVKGGKRKKSSPAIA